MWGSNGDLVLGCRRVAGAAGCGAVVHWLCSVRAGDGLGDGQLESLSHVFLHCPVVQRAVAWLQALWGQTVESRVPPVDALHGPLLAW